MKNIIQITATASGEYPETIYALTDTNELFSMNCGNNKWTALPPIPDDLLFISQE